MSRVYVATAGWSLPRDWQDRFPGEGTHLERYGRIFPAVEVNSTFYRSHRPETYARWAASVPAAFRFAVKIPRGFTHFGRLRETEGLERFLAEVRHLGRKLGPLLIQLPPSLPFDADTASSFLAALRRRFRGPVALEPRHRTWFVPAVDRLLVARRVARVAADPAPAPAAARPGGWAGLVYYRLHGAPELYRSPYSSAALRRLAAELRRAAGRSEVWCVFNNTAHGHATGNALELLTLLEQG